MNDQHNAAEFVDGSWDWEAELRKITSNHNVIVLPVLEPGRGEPTDDSASSQG